jgi:hypothetical protein
MIKPKIYWRSCGYRYGNFGDELTPHIIRSLYRRPIQRAESLAESDLISIGSILNEIPYNYSGAIWGTGAMFFYSHGEHPEAKITALRGKLSASRYHKIGYTVGDPALLCEGIIPSQEKKYDLSIVPHYVDYNNLWIKGFLDNNRSVNVIDPCGPVLETLKEISESRYILSSGLHPLIVADAMGIPNGWIYLSDGLAGGEFKFRDYYSIYRMDDITPIPFDENSQSGKLIDMLSGYQRPGISEIKDKLRKAFPL